jgi:hypothetical protein
MNNELYEVLIEIFFKVLSVLQITVNSLLKLKIYNV